MDLTRAWVAFNQHKGRIGSVVAGLLLFIAGWQLGRVMSPYYAANPIVFTEATSNSVMPPGDPTALQELREQGVVLRSPAVQVAGAATATVSPAAPSAASPASSELTKTKLYVGSVNSDKYHHRDCAAVNQIKEENKIWFATPQEAEAAGYTASKCTQDRLGR